jgi:rhamnogalacturonan endolyase
MTVRAISVAVFALSSTHAGAMAGSPEPWERLGRGLVALRVDEDRIALSWRLLATDLPGLGFHIDRESDDGAAVRLTESPILDRTHVVLPDAEPGKRRTYSVQPVLDEVELEPVASVTVEAGAPIVPYMEVPLRTPAGYQPNDASIGDLDGDGEYEIVVHQAGRGRDNSQSGVTTSPIIEAYDLESGFLWRIDLGRNIREGAHYTQFLVFDFDGDGRSELACKTADGTVDGSGKVIGDAAADHRNERGYILAGPEFLTVFDGRTGAALATVGYIPPRGDVRAWGDDYGNRVDRFLACVAFLDGKRPSLVFSRGYYERTVLASWTFGDGKLTRQWVFDSDDGTPEKKAYTGQGNHSIAVADVDGDNRDEIVFGSCVIDDDGSGLYTTRAGHGDAMHVSDLDPDRPGLEVFKANGDRSHPAGIQLRDARTGVQIWGVASTGSRGVGRALALDIDPRHRGHEMWGAGEGVEGLFDARGQRIAERAPRSCNMGAWWDGDLLRELLDGTTVSKWDWTTGETRVLVNAREHDCASNNGSKQNPCLVADIFGDWREEVIWRSEDGSKLRIFTTAIPTDRRLTTLMHDRTYRLAIAWQNVAYNQPPHPGFHLGAAMESSGVKQPTTNDLDRDDE